MLHSDKLPSQPETISIEAQISGQRRSKLDTHLAVQHLLGVLAGKGPAHAQIDALELHSSLLLASGLQYDACGAAGEEQRSCKLYC